MLHEGDNDSFGPVADAAALLPRAVSAAFQLLPGLEYERPGIWMSATTKRPDQPHLWLLLRCLPQIQVATELSTATRRLLRGNSLDIASAFEVAKAADWWQLDVLLTARVVDLVAG